MAWKRSYEYKANKTCPVCNIPITDKAKACRVHRWGEIARLQQASCEVCGKPFLFYKTNTIGRFCSKTCEGKSALMQQHRINNGNKTRLYFQKLPDSKLIDLFNKVKSGEIATLGLAFKPYGYRRIPPKRLKKLIGIEEYNNAVEQLRDRYIQDKKNFMGKRISERGYRAELLAIKRLSDTGHYVFRSAGSRGPADLIAIKDKLITLIQVKSAIREERVESYYREDIERLSKMDINALKMLWIYILRKGWRDFIVTLGGGIIETNYDGRALAKTISFGYKAGK